jgi:hypothetical protein
MQVIFPPNMLFFSRRQIPLEWWARACRRRRGTLEEWVRACRRRRGALEEW